jgi:hypothetical protein
VVRERRRRGLPLIGRGHFAMLKPAIAPG